MGIKYPIVSEIAYKTYGINEFGLDDMYLLVGDEKALLIDTGTGTIDLPRFLKQLTDKPIIAAATHWHPDHVGGMYAFHEMYMHPDDMDMIPLIRTDMRKGFVELMMSARPGMYDVNPDSVVEGVIPQLLPLKEGDVIHLGGRDVEVYETPGHTPGGISFLDRKERLIFTGDACNSNTLLTMGDHYEPRPKSGISDLLATARKIEGLHSAWDRHYNGHIGGETRTMFLPLPETLVQDCIKACECLLDGTIHGVPEGGDNMITDEMRKVLSPEKIEQLIKDLGNSGHYTLQYGSFGVQYYIEQVR